MVSKSSHTFGIDIADLYYATKSATSESGIYFWELCFTLIILSFKKSGSFIRKYKERLFLL